MKNYKKYSLDTSSKSAVIASIIILFGVTLILSNYFLSKKSYAYDYMSSQFYSENNKNIDEENKKDDIIEQNVLIEYDDISKEERVEESFNTDTYIGFLAIPKINFNKGFYSKESSLNNIEANITVMQESDYPDVKNGNLIIIGHSGTGWKAFFNELYRLGLGDIAQVSYKNNNYTYRLVNVYKQDKTGNVTIYRSSTKNILTLITCTNDDSTTQTVYIFEIENNQI